MIDREQRTPNKCPSCKGEPEPGWIEMPDNGPIVPCWLCNRERWLDDHATQRAPGDDGSCATRNAHAAAAGVPSAAAICPARPQSTPNSAVTNLCARIRGELEFFDHRRRAFDEISAGIYLTLTEWQMILDRLEIRDVR